MYLHAVYFVMYSIFGVLEYLLLIILNKLSMNSLCNFHKPVLQMHGIILFFTADQVALDRSVDSFCLAFGAHIAQYGIYWPLL